MKSNKTCRLPWPVLLVVLLATVGAISIGLTSATPVSSALDQLPTERTSESIERIPTFKPESMEESVEMTKRRMINPNIYRWIQLTRTKKRDLSSTTITPEVELESESESVDSVELSKRRMQVYGAIRYVNPADIRKRNHPSTSTTATPEEESVEGVALSKHTMRKSGQIQTVHPDDHTKRGLSSTTPGEEEEEEDYTALSRRRMMIDRPYGMMLEIEYE